MVERVRLIVTGRVQGVGYRASCARAATKIGVAGSVRNRADGSVEVIAEGSTAQLEESVGWCRQGPPFGSVTGVEVIAEEAVGLTGVQILR